MTAAPGPAAAGGLADAVDAPPAAPTASQPAPAAPTRRIDDLDGALPRRPAVAVRPWSALVCGMPEDTTLLVVDWLLLACRAAGLVAQAVPLAAGDATPHGMYVEVAADDQIEAALGELPWGTVDLVVAGEHLELMRAIDAGFVDPSITTVVSSCTRSFTRVEREVAPQHVLAEREIDAAASRASLAYHAFDGREVARWYGLSPAAQPGLLIGALCGTGTTGLSEERFAEAITELGIDPALHLEALRRGVRLGRRRGGRVRRTRTAYQFTRRRRALVHHGSRRGFEELVARAEELVHADHLPVLQEAIYRLCQFQDADWAATLVDHVADLALAERSCHGGEAPDPDASIVPDAIRSLAALLVWPDAAWIANRKRRDGRMKELRAAHEITRRDAYELVDHVPLEAQQLDAARHPRLRFGSSRSDVPPLLQPLRVERIRTTTLSGSLRLRRLAGTARHRPGSARQRHEVDTAQTWLEAMHDCLRTDHELARIVARSGTLVQGAGAVREANRATAHAFWGRIVRQSLAIDRAAARGDALVSRRVVPFAWEQLCRSGPLALWEYAAQVLGIALAHARGISYDEAVQLADALCSPRRPMQGRES